MKKGVGAKPGLLMYWGSEKIEGKFPAVKKN